MFSIKVLLSVVIIQNYCRYITFGSADFSEIRKSPDYIDKTLLIREFINNGESLVLAAPEGFGKSTNLDMIRLFLSNTVEKKFVESVFQNTKISREESLVKTHLCNHPVIHCSFKPSVPVTDYNSMAMDFRRKLRQTFLQHRYLLDSSVLSKHDLREMKVYVDEKKHKEIKPIQISVGLYFLSQILEKHHKKQVILLIDDYDSVILDSIFTKGLDVTEVIGFYNAILSGALYHNEHVNMTVLSGTTCISMKPLTDLEHVQCVKFLHEKTFEPFFGLTEYEVDELLGREGFKRYQERKADLRMWYDGYTNADLSAHIYNTRSVLNFLKSGELQSFWNKTSVENALRILLEDSVTKRLFTESSENVMIVIRHLTEIDPSHLEGLKNMIQNEMWDESYSDLYVLLLMERGFFTFDKPWELSGYNSSLTVKFTNIEICEHVRQAVADLLVADKLRTGNRIV